MPDREPGLVDYSRVQRHRYAISHTEGATFGPHPTVEDVAANWDRIRDHSLPNELDREAMPGE